MDAVLEIRKALPCRLRRVLSGERHVDRRLDRAHGRNIARTVRKDRARGHANDQLCADSLRQQRIVVAHAGAAVDPQPPRLVVHRDEQQADIGIGDDVAETLEHAVAVIVGKCDLGRPGDAHKSRRSALERAIGPALGVRRRQKEVWQAFDELLVVSRKFLSHQLLFQPVRNPAAVELVLQLPIAFVVHNAVSHGVASSSDSPRAGDAAGQFPWRSIPRYGYSACGKLPRVKPRRMVVASYRKQLKVCRFTCHQTMSALPPLATEPNDAAALWKSEIARDAVSMDARGSREAVSASGKNYPCRRPADRRVSAIESEFPNSDFDRWRSGAVGIDGDQSLPRTKV